MNAPGTPIVFARHDARRGAIWLKEAHAMLTAHRLPWLMLLLLYYLVIGIVDIIPLIGQFGLPLLKPVFAVGFLAAAWNQERGGAPELRLLFQGFRSNLWALLPLGAFMLVGISVAVLATSLVDGGKLLEVLSGKAKLDEAVLATGEVQAAMLFAAVLALPVILALWFAPALVVFQDCSAAEALATSLRAAIANWRAISVYGALVFLFGGVLPGIATAIVAAVVPAEYALVVAVAFLLPYVFLFVATLHVSDYVSYRDVFHSGERVGDSAAPPTGQR
ncbi:MAG: hypothetical protein IPG28_11760 [Betaproteobacteria bacterium]|nr:hypothetical protein [Betaproteobacteria bacterium]MBK7079879.1 hypothetical protein [Betaproteobacteria bacterium]MBK7743445.1 hypothetical protein [Betaproteobacteria bacterium]MBK8688510.1 hypothetical protein [Betaproteobacteria bacterium]